LITELWWWTEEGKEEYQGREGGKEGREERRTSRKGGRKDGRKGKGSELLYEAYIKTLQIFFQSS
jgi:hypothetical protein